MRNIFFLVATFLAAVLPAPVLGQVTIDNFAQPIQPPSGTDYLTISGGTGSAATLVQTGIDAVGGTRVFYGQKTNAGANSVTIGLSGTQAFRQNLPPGSTGRSKLLYGYSAVNTASLNTDNYTAGHTLSNLNINAGGSTGFSLDYALGGAGQTGNITVTLISGSEGAQQVASVQLPITSTAVNTTLTFARSSFLANNPALNFSDIDQVVLSLDNVPATINTAIDNIRFTTLSVPEPASMFLMAGTVGAAVGGYALRRRFRRRLRIRRR